MGFLKEKKISLDMGPIVVKLFLDEGFQALIFKESESYHWPMLSLTAS